MAQLLQVSLSATSQFLDEMYGPGVIGVRQLGSGAWSQAYAFAHDGGEKVIRWSHFADNFERDELAAGYSRDDLPIPEIIALGQTGEHFYAVSPYVAGTYLETLSTAELEKSLPSLLRMLRVLRRVDLSATTGFGIWDKEGKASHSTWESFLLDDKNDSAGSLIKGWRANLAVSPVGMGVFSQLWSRFERLVEHCPDKRQLVHSDMINGNVLAADGRITALLDWGSSIFGDALYDIAWFVFWQPWYPRFAEIDLAGQLLDDFRSDPNANTSGLNARLLCYLAHIGLDSIAYNAFRKDWHHVQEVSDYTMALIDSVPGG